MTTSPPCHLIFAVNNRDEAYRFYGGLLGSSSGRSDTSCAGIALFGHRIVDHLDERKPAMPATGTADGIETCMPFKRFPGSARAWTPLCIQDPGKTLLNLRPSMTRKADLSHDSNE